MATESRIRVFNVFICKSFIINLIMHTSLCISNTLPQTVQPEQLFEAAFQGECKATGPCQHLCFDLHDGTFECACRQGYTLSDNGYSCIENRFLLQDEDDERKTDALDNQSDNNNRLLPVSENIYDRLLADEGSDFRHRNGHSDTNTNNNNSQTLNNTPNIIHYNCKDIECEAGGTCLPDENHNDHRVRCRCPLGRGGEFCEKPMETRFPRFHGRSYLALPTLRDAHQVTIVNIEFKPEHYDGLILYSGEKQTLDGDFIAIILKQGFIELRFDCGMGEGVIKSQRPVILNSWNTLTIYRDGWSAWLQLNNDDKLTGESEGLFSQITFHLELFLGGSPNISLITHRVATHTGYIGCIRVLKINGHSYDFRSDNRGDAIDGIDIDECNADVCSQISCLNGGQCIAKSPENGICLCPLGYAGSRCETESGFSIPSFNGSSYLQYAGLGLTGLSFLEITIVFKPRDMNGLLLYNGNRLDGSGDFISINLIHGMVEVRFDLGSGPAILRSVIPIALNEWHRITFSRTGRLGTLVVDDEPTIENYSKGGYTQLYLPLNLYIGGFSDLKDVAQQADIQQSFIGCVQKVIINGKNVKLSDALSGANIVDCPHLCTMSKPCLQGGQCEPQFDYYTCHCPLGFIGSKCEREMDEMISVPMFYGNSFLQYLNEELVNRLRNSTRREIRIRFRAFSPDGILMWAGGRDTSTSIIQYLSFHMVNGYLRFTMKLTTERIELVHNRTRIDDGHWHHLQLTQDTHGLSLTVDNDNLHKHFLYNRRIHINYNYGLFLGGLDETMTTPSLHLTGKGIIGCVSSLIINNEHLSLIAQASRGVNVRPCL